MSAQAALHLTIRSIFQFVTPDVNDHEFVIYADPDGAIDKTALVAPKGS
jgi:hypothetical protein